MSVLGVHSPIFWPTPTSAVADIIHGRAADIRQAWDGGILPWWVRAEESVGLCGPGDERGFRRGGEGLGVYTGARC